ncbi:MAG: hypothetical protein FWG14_09925 [Peptococcaceae bacterium]|nr:hypothetical protein [Peptococcaceae bacterium]
MKHQQLLDKLAAKTLVKALDEDLARLVWRSMTGTHSATVESQLEYVLPKLLDRWNAVLLASDEGVSPLYKAKTILAMVTLLHKYGFADPALTEQALVAIDELNEAVALSDEFYRRSPMFKNELREAPTPLKRKPPYQDGMTFYRAEDVIALQLDGHYYAAYVRELAGTNECPVIEFYGHVFDHVPTINELVGLPAQGYSDGTIARFSVSGIKYQPDPANQITLVGACSAEIPDSSQLDKPVGLYVVTDIFSIQHTIRCLFACPIPNPDEGTVSN